MTTVDVARPVTGGGDTHLDVKVAVALDPLGGLLGVAEFPTTKAGHRDLVAYLASFGSLHADWRDSCLRNGSTRSSMPGRASFPDRR